MHSADLVVEAGSTHGEISIKGSRGGLHLTMLEQDCVRLPSARVDPESVAALLWDRLANTSLAKTPTLIGVQWLEVEVTDGAGLVATFRRSLGR
jgi:hypothetical protein